jgi:hypothetical protein
VGTEDKLQNRVGAYSEVVYPQKESIMELKCVKCGTSEGKFEGSMKHPYCQACFELVWGGSNELYSQWLASEHDTPLGKSPEAFIKSLKEDKLTLNDMLTTAILLVAGMGLTFILPKTPYFKITRIFGFTLTDYLTVVGFIILLVGIFFAAVEAVELASGGKK